jgi:hypothetical protein
MADLSFNRISEYINSLNVFKCILVDQALLFNMVDIEINEIDETVSRITDKPPCRL